MALGAELGSLLGLTLMRVARLVISGVGCGLELALVLGAWLKKALYLVPGEHGGVLYWVGVHDPESLAGVAANRSRADADGRPGSGLAGGEERSAGRRHGKSRS